MISCRRAEVEDVELFKDIRLCALQDSPDAFGSTYEGAMERSGSSWRDQLLATVSGNLRNTQFAFDASTCIGIAALYREEGLDHGALLMMWVHPDYRGTEAATLLVSNLLSWAKGIGLSSVELSVTNTKVRAIAFYQKLGFSSTGEAVDVDVERGLRGIRMTLELT